MSTMARFEWEKTVKCQLISLRNLQKMDRIFMLMKNGPKQLSASAPGFISYINLNSFSATVKSFTRSGVNISLRPLGPKDIDGLLVSRVKACMLLSTI